MKNRMAKVEEHIADALEKGAPRRTGGGAQIGRQLLSSRPFWRMFLITRKSPKETFGPLAPLFPLQRRADASSGRLTILNSARQPIFIPARDLSAFSRRRSAGINSKVLYRHCISSEVAPFGGALRPPDWAVSKYGIGYLEIKYILHRPLTGESLMNTNNAQCQRRRQRVHSLAWAGCPNFAERAGKLSVCQGCQKAVSISISRAALPS